VGEVMNSIFRTEMSKIPRLRLFLSSEFGLSHPILEVSCISASGFEVPEVHIEAKLTGFSLSHRCYPKASNPK
jgi:hypothetical protein